MKECKQCGTCCRKGGPALHSQDLHLLSIEGGIDLTDIVTLRIGELAYDQPEGAVVPLASEILKIKGVGQEWTCKFLAPSTQACRIYKDRPIECKTLFCGDPEPLRKMYDKDRITRKDVLPEGHPVFEIIEEHELKCAPLQLAELAKKILENWENSAELQVDLLEMLVYDKSIRDLLVEKSGLPADSMEFFFGRSLNRVLSGFGIIATPNGSSFSLRKTKGSA
ncbi:Putative zinc-or iron-chelating domain-containing protein [Maridesulfovibrio ferrireducens]|uniref:Putative zinc-or iron-chelating domain-containing protein n=1 Tax=Maridesulfovibrio ferrireducens TaxID=246191 RepID=A0A1G9KC03_9BACT|nr:YkgJ family cysteine cluster protein [Maridesulfovibrio ferrireducens]SDL47197.1 Putative zinc-or iron-chelating domain-containing protein [Maridesulfovibrio ferrireducens]